MDRIGGPQHVREGILRAFAQGIGVTAKISWLTQTQRCNPSQNIPFKDEDASIRTGDTESLYEGRPRWIHCTPLMGSDMKPGVIMIVMVDKEEITGTLAPPHASPLRPVRSWPKLNIRPEQPSKDIWPLRDPDPLPIPPTIPLNHSSKNPYANCLRRESGRMTDADIDASQAHMTHTGTTTSVRSQYHTAAPSGRNSVHGTMTPRRESTSSFCSRGNGLDVLDGHDTTPGAGMSGVSLRVNERDGRGDSTTMPDIERDMNGYPLDNHGREFIVTGVSVVKPEKVESKKIRPFEALLRKHKKSS